MTQTQEPAAIEAIRARHWLDWYEVGRDGRPWKAGKTLRCEKLHYIREPMDQVWLNASVRLALLCPAPGEQMMCDGVYRELLKIAGNHDEPSGAQAPTRRGWVADADGQAYTVESLAERLRMTMTQTCSVVQRLIKAQLIEISPCPWAVSGSGLGQLTGQVWSGGSDSGVVPVPAMPVSAMPVPVPVAPPVLPTTPAPVAEPVAPPVPAMSAPAMSAPALPVRDFVGGDPDLAAGQVADRARKWLHEMVPSLFPAATASFAGKRPAESDLTSIRNRIRDAWDLGGSDLVCDLITLMQQKEFAVANGGIQTLLATWHKAALAMIKTHRELAGDDLDHSDPAQGEPPDPGAGGPE